MEKAVIKPIDKLYNGMWARILIGFAIALFLCVFFKMAVALCVWGIVSLLDLLITAIRYRLRKGCGK